MPAFGCPALGEIESGFWMCMLHLLLGAGTPLYCKIHLLPRVASARLQVRHAGPQLGLNTNYET